MMIKICFCRDETKIGSMLKELAKEFDTVVDQKSKLLLGFKVIKSLEFVNKIKGKCRCLNKPKSKTEQY